MSQAGGSPEPRSPAGVPCRLGARVVIAGTRSGSGKTTVSTGIMAALRSRGLAVASAKAGPDYIDPGYHALATGRPGTNLDAWMSGLHAVAPLAARCASGSDILVVEGVMGLFDGVGATTLASSADLAAALDAPVVLVVDAAGMGASVAALVRGYRDMRPELRFGGVILNMVGSDRHEEVLRAALASCGASVLGALRRGDVEHWRERHLGLVPVAEDPSGAADRIAKLAALVSMRIDLEAVLALARSAPPLMTVLPQPARRVGSARVAVAAGKAFSFHYPENLRRIEEAGGELCFFDPLADADLPAGSTALYAAGGFPEIYAAELTDNVDLCARVKEKVLRGLVTWAECGGLLWLCRDLGGAPLCGALPASGRMTGRLTLGYREARLRKSSPIAASGSVLRGHEFHYSAIEPSGDGLLMQPPSAGGLADAAAPGVAGFCSPTMIASYLHVHLGADPLPAERFVAAASAPTGGAGRTGSVSEEERSRRRPR